MSSRRVPPILPVAEERAIAVNAQCDPRTVRRALRGIPVQPLVLTRIRLALKRVGRAELLPADAPVVTRPRLGVVVALPITHNARERAAGGVSTDPKSCDNDGCGLVAGHAGRCIGTAS